MRYSKIKELEIDEVIVQGGQGQTTLHQIEDIADGEGKRALRLRNLTGKDGSIITQWGSEAEVLVLTPDEALAMTGETPHEPLNLRDRLPFAHLQAEPVVRHEPGNVDGEYHRVPRATGVHDPAGDQKFEEKPRFDSEPPF